MRSLRFLIAFLATSVAVFAAPADEIEALLEYVGALDGASFVRNGSTHTPAEAVSHLRLKWDKQSSDIATAENFIRLCGTKSSISGQPYLIRFKDGREEECAAVLTRQLKVIRAKTKAGEPGPTARSG